MRSIYSCDRDPNEIEICNYFKWQICPHSIPWCMAQRMAAL